MSVALSEGRAVPVHFVGLGKTHDSLNGRKRSIFASAEHGGHLRGRLAVGKKIEKKRKSHGRLGEKP